MKLFGIQCSDSGKKQVNLKGKRSAKNVVSQLIKNNSYSLTAPNTRYILKSVNELSNVAGEKNIKFLMNVAANNKYSTNITLQDNPKVNWKSVLASAIKHVIAITPFINQEEFINKVDEIVSHTELSPDEKEILNLKKSLIKAVNLEQIKKETVGGIQDFEKNLDYFIVSSETTIKDKKYVLERLNYLMSYKYGINPQLKDKKSIVAAEIVNDIAIATPGHKIPNIKAVNQKQHGMCAAISIVRKKLAYEDKPNYIDSILSELDSSPYIKVYDRSKLGSGEKIEIKKVDVDYDAAIAKGYRIIDASTTLWMQVSGHTGYSASSSKNYRPFDTENFDVRNDSFFNARFDDAELNSVQSYYQALNKVKNAINDYKAAKIKKDVYNADSRRNTPEILKVLSSTMSALKNNLKAIDNLAQNTDIEDFSAYLLRLEHKVSSKIPANNRFAYLANEERAAKLRKIKSAICDRGINADSVTEEQISAIFDLIDFYHETVSQITGAAKPSAIRKAQELYEIGAGYRYQLSEGLNCSLFINEIMSAEKLPDRESLIIKHIDSLIDIIKNGKAEHKKMIITQLSEKLSLDEPSYRAVIKHLVDLKNNMEFMLETAFDNIYVSLGQGSKREALKSFIDNVIYDIRENGNENTLYMAEENLGTKNYDETLNKLENMKEKVLSSSEEEYSQIFNMLGEHSQINNLKQTLYEIATALNNSEDDEIAKALVEANGMSTENCRQNADDLLNAIAKQIDSISDSVDKYTEFLKITDKEGDIIFSPDPKDIIISKYEAKKEIPTAKELRELQNHLDKIQKIKSKDEFNSRQGKISDKSLLKFSKSEKNTLEYIDKNINNFNRYLQKQITVVQNNMKDSFEELNRQVGVEDGKYWVFEGSSGLMSGQQIRILEYITGRPHYETSNLEAAVKKIKTSPYSGITTSSVFHDKIGMHAQYVADIAPVKVKIKDENGNEKTEEKEVLFQDNTWGASEHENVWTDEAGLKRTDYSDNRGGTLGYITNEQFQNGNYVDRILNEMVLEEHEDKVSSKLYKKIKHPSDEMYATTQYTGIILDGKSSDTEDIADSIHDTLFSSSASLLPLMKNFLKDMTVDEVTSKINDIKNRTYNWETRYENIKKRIFAPLGSGIQTERQYNMLPDNDELKVIFEKAALNLNYKMTDMTEKISGVKNVKELEKYKKVQLKRASSDFRYAFTKDFANVTYFGDSITEKEIQVIDDILEKHSIKLSDKDFEHIFLNFNKVQKNFDGSLKNTINYLSGELEEKLKEKIENQNIIDELVSYFRNLAVTKMYFNAVNLRTLGEDSGIVKFIDRIFDPQDDEEFVEIFKNIQDMTTKEFNEEILSKANNEDLGIGTKTGYSVLKEFILHKSEIETAIENVIYQESLSDNSDYKKYKITYDLKKLTREPKYSYKHDFESIYKDMKNSLYLLSIPKFFNKYKNQNLIKYGAYPAYPKLDYMPESMLVSDFEFLSSNMPEIVSRISATKNLLRYYDLTDEVIKMTKNFKDADIVTDEDYTKLNLLLGEIVTMVYDDESAKEVFDAASNAMELEEGTAFLLYKDYIKRLINFAENYKKNVPPETLKTTIASQKDVLAKEVELFTNTLIQKRYRGKINLLIQKYKKSLIRRDKNTDELLNELWSEFGKSYILNNPDEILDSYALAAAKDSPSSEMLGGYSALLDRALKYSVLYDIQMEIMKAVKRGVETGVKTKFNDIEIPLITGESKTMGADEIIDQMVFSLILDNDMETALMFLDKFGLNEQFVTYSAKNFNYDEIKKLMKTSTDMYNNFDDFSKIYTDALAKTTEEIRSGASPIKAMNHFKAIIKDASLKYSIDNKTKLISKAIDKAKEEYTKNPSYSAADILETLVQDAMSEVATSENASFENTNSVLGVYETMFQLVNNLKLLENCEAAKSRDLMNKVFYELQKYRENLDKQNSQKS